MLSKDWYIALFLYHTESVLAKSDIIKEDFVYMGLKLRSVTFHVDPNIKTWEAMFSV